MSYDKIVDMAVSVFGNFIQKFSTQHPVPPEVFDKAEQKFVFKVENMSTEKRRMKARVVVAKTPGVEGLVMEGDKIWVIGKGIDELKLGRALTKNVGPTNIMNAVVKTG